MMPLEKSAAHEWGRNSPWISRMTRMVSRGECFHPCHPCYPWFSFRLIRGISQWFRSAFFMMEDGMTPRRASISNPAA
jgi:hypothetical protein